jgi:exopolyphosphatase/guanosine-5'-triphosphate,3'-diphosphate pyrophosphatase
MARITAVIDIGSNSVRMAVFERTSRFGFHLLREAKARVRISENAWKNGGELQEPAIARTEAALVDFVRIARAFKARRTLAVATSAVRDAPNRAAFIRRIYRRTGLQIRVISGEQEAQLGGLAAANLLPLQEGVTIDIGGGSTELARIENAQVRECVSFPLGTVRLKELFFDENPDIKGALRYVSRTISTLPESFQGKPLIGVGGTLRALANVLMKRDHYPFDVLHGYRFDLLPQRHFLAEIIRAHPPQLRKIGFKPERLDVIREGVLILTRIARKIGSDRMITSGVGVREGLYLQTLLRGSGMRFAPHVQPSLESLCDRFSVDRALTGWLARCSLDLFEVLSPLHRIETSYKPALSQAAQLLSVGDFLNHYDRARNGYQITLSGLAYGYEHHERILIATLIRAQQKKTLGSFEPSAKLARLLPSPITLRWLALCIYLANTLNTCRTRPKLRFELSGKTLVIYALEEVGSITQTSLEGFKPPFGLTVALKTADRG